MREPTISGSGISDAYKAQLQALLDFYSSEMGKSILDSQNRLVDDMGFKLQSNNFNLDD